MYAIWKSCCIEWNVMCVRKQWPKIYFIAPYFNGWAKRGWRQPLCSWIMWLVISGAQCKNNDRRLCVAAAHHIDKYHFRSRTMPIERGQIDYGLNDHTNAHAHTPQCICSLNNCTQSATRSMQTKSMLIKFVILIADNLCINSCVIFFVVNTLFMHI